MLIENFFVGHQCFCQYTFVFAKDTDFKGTIATHLIDSYLHGHGKVALSIPIDGTEVKVLVFRPGRIYILCLENHSSGT